MDIIVNESLPELPTNTVSIEHYHDYYLNLLHSLGYDKPPLADLLRLYQNQKPGKWLILSPIYWQASHNDARIIASGKTLSLSYEQGYQWFQEVAAFLTYEDLTLVYHGPSLWLVEIGHKPPLGIQALPLAQANSMKDLYQNLDSYWLRIMTEVQMWLANHPLNKDKYSYINGLWPWGEGDFLQRCNRKIITNDKVIGHYLGADHYNVHTSVKKYDLLVLNPKPNWPNWQNNLQTKNARWFWNNNAYQVKNKPWWHKFIRKYPC